MKTEGRLTVTIHVETMQPYLVGDFGADHPHTNLAALLRELADRLDLFALLEES